MAQVVPQGGCLDGIRIQSAVGGYHLRIVLRQQPLRQAPGDLRHLDRVGQAVVEAMAFHGSHHLGYVGQTP